MTPSSDKSLEPCWIYMAISPCGKFIKIGRTNESDLHRKRCSLRKQASVALGIGLVDFKFIAVFRGIRMGEEKLCSRFNSHAIKNGSEWFYASKELLDFAEAVGVDPRSYDSKTQPSAKAAREHCRASRAQTV